VDGIAERITEQEFLSRIEKFQPDLIVLEVSTASMDTDLRQAREAKKQCPESSIVFCGPHLGMYEPAFFERVPEVHYVLQGEYEYILRDLVSALETGGKMEAIRGLGFRDSGGRGIVNPRAEVIRDLDSLPWPSRKHLPIRNYYDQPGAIPEPTLQIWASRGCPFQCVFCAWPQIMYGNNLYRTRNPVDVVDEIEAMKNEYGFRSVYFDDDTFNIGKKRILALCEEMRKRNLGLPWAAMARADTSDRETLQAMKDAGLVAIKYGVESASQELIDRAKKGLDLDRVEETVRITRELGIRQHLTFSFGLPGETWETIRKTIDLSKRLDPETVQYSIMTPYPGSSFYQDMQCGDDRDRGLFPIRWHEHRCYPHRMPLTGGSRTRTQTGIQRMGMAQTHPAVPSPASFETLAGTPTRDLELPQVHSEPSPPVLPRVTPTPSSRRETKVFEKEPQVENELHCQKSGGTRFECGEI